MNRNNVWLIAAVTALVVPLAWAQDAPSPDRPAPKGPPAEAQRRPGPRGEAGPQRGMPMELSQEQIDSIFKAFDADGNGQIDKQELAKRMPSMMARLHNRARMEGRQAAPTPRERMQREQAKEVEKGLRDQPPRDQAKGDKEKAKQAQRGPARGDNECPLCARKAGRAARSDAPGRGAAYRRGFGGRAEGLGRSFADARRGGPRDERSKGFSPRGWDRGSSAPAFRPPGAPRGLDRLQRQMEPRGFGPGPRGWQSRDDDGPPTRRGWQRDQDDDDDDRAGPPPAHRYRGQRW